MPDHSESELGRLPVGVYILYARLVFFTLIAFMAAPLLHCILPKLHFESRAGD